MSDPLTVDRQNSACTNQGETVYKISYEANASRNRWLARKGAEEPLHFSSCGRVPTRHQLNLSWPMPCFVPRNARTRNPSTSDPIRLPDTNSSRITDPASRSHPIRVHSYYYPRNFAHAAQILLTADGGIGSRFLSVESAKSAVDPFGCGLPPSVHSWFSSQPVPSYAHELRLREPRP